MSSFTWLDFSEADRQRAQDVIDLFREQETRDELGTATIRDALSDWFFPGTSAIQSRARYFFIIPWIYQRLEERKVESAEFARRARDEELKLIDVLADSDDAEGTIGVRARRTLKRLPSSVYWQGLNRLGILVFPGSRDQYHRAADGFYLRRAGGAVRNDDGEVVSSNRVRNWHPSMPKAPRGFPQACSLALTYEEADYLRERIMHAAPSSLFARLVDAGNPVPDTEFPWEMSGLDRLPERIRTDLNHARQFSELMHGANLLYNFWLAEKRKSRELIARYDAMLDLWTTDRARRREAHQTWRLEDLWELVARAGGRVPSQTREFVTSWVAIACANLGRDLRKNTVARTLIHERERQLKRSLARLDGGRALELWGGESGSRQIDYRWKAIVMRVVQDIHEGLEADHA